MLDYSRPRSLPPGGFITVPKSARSLAPNALKVLLLALDWPPSARRSFSQAAVVRACPELGRDAVRTAFTQLCDAGMLTRTPGRRGTVVYRLDVWNVAPSDEPTGSDGATSDEPTPVGSGEPTVTASGEPTPNTQDVDFQDPLLSPTVVVSAPPAAVVGEEDFAVRDGDAVRVWAQRFVAALPVAVRPVSLPDRLVVEAARWAGHDPDLVAEVVAQTLPPQVRSPAGLLISKLAGGVSDGQVAHAAQRREFARRRAAAAADVGGGREAAGLPNASAAAAMAATVRAAMGPLSVAR